MKKILIFAFFMAVGFAVGVYGRAEAVSVFVDGKSGPWDVTLNPSYSYGWTGTFGWSLLWEPTVVDNSSGLPMTVGDTLTISYASGLASPGGPIPGVDANGAIGWFADGSTSGAPGYYVPDAQKPVWLEELMGVFASSGVIVGSPFNIGNGPLNISIPTGASELLLGFSDGWYNDNGGGVNVEVMESSNATVPEPSTMLLMGSGLAGLAVLRKRLKVHGS